MDIITFYPYLFGIYYFIHYYTGLFIFIYLCTLHLWPFIYFYYYLVFALLFFLLPSCMLVYLDLILPNLVGSDGWLILGRFGWT